MSSTVYWFLLKTGSLDNAILELWLAQPSWYMSHYTMLSKYGNCTHLLKIKNKPKISCFYKVGKNFRYFVDLFNKTIIIDCGPFHKTIIACWIWDDYSQLGTTSLVEYLPFHIQCTLAEYIKLIQCGKHYGVCMLWSVSYTHLTLPTIYSV